MVKALCKAYCEGHGATDPHTMTNWTAIEEQGGFPRCKDFLSLSSAQGNVYVCRWEFRVSDRPIKQLAMVMLASSSWHGTCLRTNKQKNPDRLSPRSEI